MPQVCTEHTVYCPVCGALEVLPFQGRQLLTNHKWKQGGYGFRIYHCGGGCECVVFR